MKLCTQLEYRIYSIVDEPLLDVPGAEGMAPDDHERPLTRFGNYMLCNRSNWPKRPSGLLLISLISIESRHISKLYLLRPVISFSMVT
jgi:hypothetical protein